MVYYTYISSIFCSLQYHWGTHGRSNGTSGVGIFKWNQGNIWGQGNIQFIFGSWRKVFFSPEVLMFPEKKFRSQTKLTFNVEPI